MPENFKVTKSGNVKITKPSETTHPRKRKYDDSDEPKKKWHKDYNYGAGEKFCALILVFICTLIIPAAFVRK